ncbi:MAG TPA: hypothetical protein VGE16_07155 [Albitalea sp.]
MPPWLYAGWVRDARDYVRPAEQINGAIAASVAMDYVLGDALAEMGADFRAGAVQPGTAAIRGLVGAVDFPSFVGGLVQNVFHAIVTASIQQMRAYAEIARRGR